MALLEYVLEYGKAVYRVVELDPGDRIRFSGDAEQTGIEFVGSTPFSAKNAPQANKPFVVGDGTTAEFKVTKELTQDNAIHFNCGDVVGSNLHTWGTGNGTPPEG